MIVYFGAANNDTRAILIFLWVTVGAEYGKKSWGADLTGLANLSGLPQNAAILYSCSQRAAHMMRWRMVRITNRPISTNRVTSKSGQMMNME
jgi:hypothetical protein